MRIGDAIIRDATKVTKTWTTYQERRIRSWGRAAWRPPRAKKVTIKDIAWRVMPQAYQKAAGRVNMAAPRQVFYAARPLILAALADDTKVVNSVYFTQVLLPDYMAAHPSETASWDLLWDDRGHLREPHTGKEIGLGTLAVREYLAACREGPATGIEIDPIETDYPTRGPQHRYRHVLLIEKEGFQQLFEHVGIETRYDLAIMSSKGMNTTSARTLVEQLPGVRFLVLHDFDKAGFSILGTLTRSTRRYRFHRRAEIIDLGIRVEDVEMEHLETEPVHYTHDPEANLRQNGATEAEIDLLVRGGRRGQRVELNAFPSDQLIAWLERKLTAHGVTKFMPAPEALKAAYRRAVHIKRMNAALKDAHENARKSVDRIRVPKTLARRVRGILAGNPMLSWDAAVAQLCDEGGY